MMCKVLRILAIIVLFSWKFSFTRNCLFAEYKLIDAIFYTIFSHLYLGYIHADYIITSQPSSSVCSDSEQSTISQCSFFIQSKNAAENPLSVTYTIPENDSTEFYAEDELWKMEDESDSSDKQNRPSYLDLAGNSGSTPVVSRKPRFQFTGTKQTIRVNKTDLHFAITFLFQLLRILTN